MRLLLWPGDLHLERFVAVNGWAVTTTALAWVTLGLAGAALALGARRVVIGYFWLGLFLAAYAPVSGLVPAYRAIADRALFMPEHFLYLPLLGLAPLATGLVAAWLPRRTSRFAPAILALCVLVWGVIVLDRGRDWHDEDTLFRHTIRYDPPVARVWFNLANLRLADGDLEEAETLYRAALDRAPRDAGIHLNLGIVLQRQRRLTEAETHYEAAIRFDPGHAEARRALAALLLRQGQTGRARRLLEQAQTPPDGVVDGRDHHNRTPAGERHPSRR
jgi:tetratricopeptide (TPR) repeat protein